WRSISPTDCWDDTRRLNIARRFGSAMISKTDSIPCVYSTEHILVKVYLGRGSKKLCHSESGRKPGEEPVPCTWWDGHSCPSPLTVILTGKDRTRETLTNARNTVEERRFSAV